MPLFTMQLLPSCPWGFFLLANRIEYGYYTRNPLSKEGLDETWCPQVLLSVSVFVLHSVAIFFVFVL